MANAFALASVEKLNGSDMSRHAHERSVLRVLRRVWVIPVAIFVPDLSTFAVNYDLRFVLFGQWNCRLTRELLGLVS